MSSEGSEYWIGLLGSRAKLQAEYINVNHSEEVAIPVADETASDYAAKDTNETAKDNKISSFEDKVSNDKTDLLKETGSALTDNVISASLCLFKEEHPGIGGLQPTVLGANLSFDVQKGAFVQVHIETYNNCI